MDPDGGVSRELQWKVFYALKGVLPGPAYTPSFYEEP